MKNYTDWEEFVNQCYEGLTLNLEVKSQLIHNAFYVKSAFSMTDYSSKSLPENKSWFWMEIQEIFQHMLDFGEISMVFEFAQILNKNKLPLPSNCLLPLLNWSLKEPLVYYYSIPVLGHLGFETIDQFHNFEKLRLHRKFNLEHYRTEKDKSIFLNSYLRYFMEDAMSWIEKNGSILKTKEKILLCRSLYKYCDLDHFTIIENLIDRETSPLIQLALLNILSKIKPEHIETVISSINPSIDTLPDHVFINLPSDKQIKLSLDKFLAGFSLDWINKINDRNKLFKNIAEKNLLSSLLEGVYFTKDYNTIKLLFEYLLEHQLLTYNLSIDVISASLNYTEFNQCALQWLQYYRAKSPDNIDLEAFYRFVKIEKHFWSDALIEEILMLKTNTKLMRKYDMDVFYQLMPFRMNPNSNIAKKIEQEASGSIPHPLTFERILFFRNQLRRINIS